MRTKYDAFAGKEIHTSLGNELADVRRQIKTLKVRKEKLQEVSRSQSADLKAVSDDAEIKAKINLGAQELEK